MSTRELEHPTPRTDAGPRATAAVLACNRGVAAAARRLLARTLDDHGLDGLVADASLAISEAVTNVWRHTDAVVVPVTIVCDDRSVTVSVENPPDSTPPARRDRGRRPGEGGLGLEIIAAITDTCGWTRTPAGVAYEFSVSRRQLHP